MASISLGPALSKANLIEKKARSALHAALPAFARSSCSSPMGREKELEAAVAASTKQFIRCVINYPMIYIIIRKRFQLN